MEAIREWVRNLVVIMVLAGLADLLVPMGNMKRFVRLNMGLVVLLAVLGPLLTLLGQPLVIDPPAQTPGAGGLRPLSEVLAGAAALRAQNEGLITRQMRLRLQAEAEAAAVGVPGVAAATATVELAGGSPHEPPHLTAVRVEIMPGAQDHGAAVQQVQPVRIGGAEPQPGEAGAPPAAPDPRPALVRRAVAERLALGEQWVSVTWQQGAEGER